MASLRKRASGVYYLEYRYRDRHFHRSLETRHERDARQLKASVERTLALLKEGVLQLPEPVTADGLWQFLRSGGKQHDLPEVLRFGMLAFSPTCIT